LLHNSLLNFKDVIVLPLPLYRNLVVFCNYFLAEEGKLPFPSASDLNTRFRRIITGYQRTHKQGMLKLEQISKVCNICFCTEISTWNIGWLDKIDQDLVLRPNSGLRLNLHKVFKWRQGFSLIFKISPEKIRRNIWSKTKLDLNTLV